MGHPHLPEFPYGAVYFRKSNPPRDDWSRDYQTAAEDGMNIFRHWFLWGAIEVAPGRYDWDDYDRQLDLAAEHGIKTIIAEMITAAPEWAFRKYSHARYERRTGEKVDSQLSASCATGGFPGLCYDNDDARAAAGEFLHQLASRYANHPGLGGYDIWNECNIAADVCYCPATAAKFREWLKARYGTPEAVAKAWHRYSFAAWEDIEPPRFLQPYPEVLDWLRFRIDRAYELMKWRIDIIKAADPTHAITAHGIAASLSSLASGAADDWRAADLVEVYGLTFGSSRHGDEPWKQYSAIDLVRAAALGKPFWHAESYAGPLWMQSNVLNKPRDEGRIAQPDDAPYWNMVSFAGGATGALYLRWRPLLDGPLFGAFGPYGLDGSRTERSRRVSAVAKWVAAPEQKSLWQSRPVAGDLGVVVVPESQLFAYAQQGNVAYYKDSVQGAYQGFFSNNIQADYVHIDHIERYDVLYLPYPVMLPPAVAEALVAWVEKGGTLISEGCPGYFDAAGHVHPSELRPELAALFGARQAYVEFTPDLLEELQVTVAGHRIWGGLFLQTYATTSGTAVGYTDAGQVVAVENRFGKGKALLIGTFPGYGFARHARGGSAAESRRRVAAEEMRSDRDFFRWLLGWAGKEQHVAVSDTAVTARIHDGEGGTYLWITNPVRAERAVELTLSARWAGSGQLRVRYGQPGNLVRDGRTIRLAMPGRGAVVLQL